MSPLHTRAGAWLDIDLGAVQANWRFLQAQVGGARCGGVVKADAYGLGAAQVAPALYAAGCRDFFVAHLDEALQLRSVLPADAVLVVMHGLLPGSEPEALAHGIVPVLNSLAQIEAWRHLAQAQTQVQDRALPAWLQVDTGMARLGLSADELDSVATDHSLLRGVALQGVMSHLVSAEDPSLAVNAQQLQRFQVARVLLPAAPASLANSSGVFLGPAFHFDVVRPGAALYGIAPVAGQPNPMQPVVSLRSKVIQVREIPAGSGVGYGHAWTAPRRSRIATLATGYADGWLRSLSNRAQLRFEGYTLPLVGKVSMDTVTVDITDTPPDLIGPGTLITLIDQNSHSAHSVDAVATAAGTIGYEILTSLGSRYARRYLNGTSNAA